MAINGIRASMFCDGCGTGFNVQLDPALEINGGTLMDAVENEMNTDFDKSIQHGMHLCQNCTSIADNIGDEDYQPSRDEIETAIKEKLDGLTS